VSTILSSIGVGALRLWNRRWPFGLGKELPNRLIARATNMGLVQRIWFEFQPGLWMQLDMRELVQETLLLDGIWEPKTTQYLCSSLTFGHVFMDIGANAGYFSLLASRCVGQAGKVLAVEPNPAMAKQLRQNTERSGLTNVDIAEAACFDSVEVRDLYIGNPYNTGNSSLSGNNLAWTKSVEVACTTVDLLVEKHGLQRVDLVKIDVEGAELQVLRGMSATLKRLRPKIITELSSSLLEAFSVTLDTVQEYFRDIGYSVTPLEEDCMGRTTNYLCVPVEYSGMAHTAAANTASAKPGLHGSSD
jgi:FkbM family methyltransferase